MHPPYTVIIHTPQELNHSSYIQTGLFELAHKGLIRVKVKLFLKKNRGAIYINNNSLTEIPQAVCDLNTDHGTYIFRDPGLNCGTEYIE